MPDVWEMPAGEVLKELSSSESGLKTEEAQRRLKKFGPNTIERKRGHGSLRIFLEQFKSFLVLLLVFAAVISVFFGEFIDSAAIATILVINALLGFWQEYKSEKAIETIKKMVVKRAVVLRNGAKLEIPAEELVPGDIVFIEAGERIPADIRVLQSFGLRLDESILTGESVSVGKIIEKVQGKQLGDRKNMLYMGTLAVEGTGEGVVVSTGSGTEMGKIAKLIEEPEEPTKFQKDMDKFGKKVGYIIVVIALAVFLLDMLRGAGPVNSALIAITLAVAAVPEGLPAVVTITLARGIQKMAKRNAFVRRLSSVESLGMINVICADKTGTMTSNQMTVRKIWTKVRGIDIAGLGYNPEGNFLDENKETTLGKEELLLLRTGMLCNNAALRHNKNWEIVGDPTEGALIVAAEKAGINVKIKREYEIPFSSERRMMSVVCREKDGLYVYTKGAPEVILQHCIREIGGQMTSGKRHSIEEEFSKMAESGLRVLALAYKSFDGNLKQAEEGLIFIGLVGMIDPPTEETKHSVAVCKEAGIRPIMITGDHLLTAKAISKEVGIEGDAVTGEDLETMDGKLEKTLDNISIFARVSPLQKLKIIEALHKRGDMVSMTGDGVNDAPALKKADVGVAMGRRGSDAAREASDIVLADDNFSTIVYAVEEGRGIFDNIKKFVHYLIGANIAEVLAVVGSLLFFLPLPFTPLQLLWINLTTDGLPALALGFEKKHKGIMKEKPKGAETGILKGGWSFLFAVAVVGAAAVLFSMFLTLPQGIEKARTVAFTTMTFFELFLVFSIHAGKDGLLKTNPFSNTKLVLAVLTSVLLQILVIYMAPLQILFDTVPLALGDWLTVLLLSATGLFVSPKLFLKEEKN